MDYKIYIEKKAKGLAGILKINGSYAVSYKKFDPETGAELTAEVQAFTIKDLTDKQLDLQTEIDSIQAVVDEAEAL
tara:strand:+ start:92 stop:319 length:228 start_codon:yes stop_codon:yes gene_type:complete